MTGPGPIGYRPPANPYQAMPIEPGSFHGLNPLPAQAAAAQAMAPIAGVLQQQEAQDTQAEQAAKFQNLLNQGKQGMQAYIADVAKEHPDLAPEFTQEFQAVAPYMSQLKGKELTDMALNIFDSWNGRVKGKQLAAKMSDPMASQEDIYAASGLGAKDMLSAYSLGKQRDAQASYLGAKTDYTKNLGDLKKQLQEMQDRSRERAARIRVSKGAGGATYQYTLKTAQDNLTSVDDEIKALETKMAGMDPMEANFLGMNTQMHQLRTERMRYQGWANKAIEKGAKPNDLMDAGADDLGASPGATPDVPADGGASAPGKPGLTMPTITDKSSDDEISLFLRQNNAMVSPETIAKVRDNYRKRMSAQGVK